MCILKLCVEYRILVYDDDGNRSRVRETVTTNHENFVCVFQ